MPYFVRKIEFAKWNQRNILEGEPPSADAITNCMKTKQNTLSLWRIHDVDELEDAVLAIAAAGDHIDTLYFIYLDSDIVTQHLYLDDEGLGVTPFEKFKSRHTDVKYLDYVSLGKLADSTTEAIKNSQYERYNQSNIKKILAEGIKSGKIRLEDLGPHIQKKMI